MAKEIIGVSRCVTGFGLDFNKFYFPKGRHLRGAFGFTCYLTGNPLLSYFENFYDDSLIFRDMFPLCSRCNTMLLPRQDELTVTCTKCKTQTYIKLFNIRTTKYLDQQVAEGLKYRVSIIVKNESLLDRVREILEYMKSKPFYIGKRISQGWGRFILENYSVVDRDESELHKKALIISEIVDPKGVLVLKVGNSANLHNEFELVNLKYFPRYKEVNNIRGFYYGDLGNLGFGEILKIE